MPSKQTQDAVYLRGSHPWPSLYRKALGCTESERAEIEGMLEQLIAIPPLSDSDYQKNIATIMTVKETLSRLERYINLRAIFTLKHISIEVEVGYFDSEELISKLKSIKNITYPNLLLLLLRLEGKDYVI